MDDSNKDGARPGWGRWAVRLCVSGLPLVLLGCWGDFHPIRPPEDWELAGPPAPPRASQEHVYIFFVHGLDPLDYANLSGLRRFVHDLGYSQTYFGQVYHSRHFAQVIRRIHASDDQAHFVLVGFSAGANTVRTLANDLASEGIVIDLMVYLGGNTLRDEQRNRPANVKKILHILCEGYIWKGHDIAGVENIRYAGKWHFDSPTHPETLRRLAEELAAISGQVPILVPVVPADPEQAPPPRPVPPAQPVEAAPRESQAAGEWDLLRSKAYLEPPASRWPLRSGGSPEQSASRPPQMAGR
jgi:hypothetical protein